MIQETRLALVIPVYNDWGSFCVLVDKIDHLLSQRKHISLDVRVVNDGSLDPVPDKLKNVHPVNIRSVEIIHLVANFGHQMAIAVGLNEVLSEDAHDAVVVIDSDGEDRPEDIFEMLTMYEQGAQDIVVAERKKRQDGCFFQFFLMLYRNIFYALIGVNLSFGNFVLIPKRHLKRLIYTSGFGKHLAGMLIKTRLPIQRYGQVRGTRYAGRSSMDFTRFVLHGLQSIAIFSDVVFIRISIVMGGVVLIAAIGIGAVLFVRFFTGFATSGWATSAIGSLGVMALLALSVLLNSIFFVINNSRVTENLPADGFSRCVDRKEKVS